MLEENLVPFIMVEPNKISEHILKKNKNRVMPLLRKVTENSENQVKFNGAEIIWPESTSALNISRRAVQTLKVP